MTSLGSIAIEQIEALAPDSRAFADGRGARQALGLSPARARRRRCMGRGARVKGGRLRRVALPRT